MVSGYPILQNGQIDFFVEIGDKFCPSDSALEN